jgi:DNA-binding Lrp family transcriptional regulator
VVAPSGPLDVDEIDRRMTAVLADDGRISINELAARVNVSRATAYARFERLRERGVITGFRAEIDAAKVGFPIAALVLVNVHQRDWRTARDELAALPGVEYIALTSGGFDFVVLVRVPSSGALRDVLLVKMHALPSVRSTQTIFILDEQRQPFAGAHYPEPDAPPATH